MQAGAKLTHILELTFKQQIFMIFIVDYFCKKEFLKIDFFLIQHILSRRHSIPVPILN